MLNSVNRGNVDHMYAAFPNVRLPHVDWMTSVTSHTDIWLLRLEHVWVHRRELADTVNPEETLARIHKGGLFQIRGLLVFQSIDWNKHWSVK